MFIADRVERVGYKSLIPADYNPRQMDARTLRVLVGSLLRFGWVMPVVINRRTGNIVGGHQRARANAVVVTQLRSKGDKRAAEYERPPAIYVDVSLSIEKAMNVALNQISGDWDFFKKTAADQLRQNATYAQMRRIHLELGRGYKAPVGILDFNLRNREHRERFKATFGQRVLDFGAGGRQEVGWLRSKLGIDAVGFEPFPRDRSKLSTSLAQRSADDMLGRLEKGWRPETVICQFVISSIGSAEDRRQVLTILAALGRLAKQVVIAVRSVDDVCYQQVLGKVNARTGGYLGIPDATEPGLIVTSAGTSRQKFQKFYGVEEFRDVLREYFTDIRQAALEERDSALVMVCRKPRRMSWPVLSKALRFEFELSIDGVKMDRSKRALAVFRKLR